MALMKSHRPSRVVTQISWAPTPFISGIARFGRLIRGSIDAGGQFGQRQRSIAVRVDGRERLGQQSLGRLLRD